MYLSPEEEEDILDEIADACRRDMFSPTIDEKAVRAFSQTVLDTVRDILIPELYQCTNQIQYEKVFQYWSRFGTMMKTMLASASDVRPNIFMSFAHHVFCTCTSADIRALMPVCLEKNTENLKDLIVRARKMHIREGFAVLMGCGISGVPLRCT